jgi:hypothetical protein
MAFYSDIISAYLSNEINISKMCITLQSRSLSNVEIDERITSYLRCSVKEIINVDKLVITAYLQSWYNVLNYLIITGKYLYLTKGILYGARLTPKFMLIHARNISDKFKCSPAVIPYLQVFEVKQFFPMFRLNELRAWRNTWPQYINIKKLNKWIDKESWRLSMRNYWITACIVV